ncbi:mitochondrial 54S ribosomal protein uL22m NDAI_0F03340 [Naumovozyma dairenensis CBS 421]|uniref:Ribosomal protein L22 n=1 Tax=Naumovozyma dairenensis (strain ATCC 10597 / BCRC 20456 / CBS 421 / NBRC 0211 / NRRL Y-12639) TaxID=1071378 RepID=G0WCZ1_NAUDC|nr:hypothetical protein NDAI_0F03340 [Naumovozyma dairenensis CBS 421]CCD25652.1 hypothetical protein NDAI_0F03340 [Naumovozyma dairenensis CBS 421]
MLVRTLFRNGSVSANRLTTNGIFTRSLSYTRYPLNEHSNTNSPLFGSLNKDFDIEKDHSPNKLSNRLATEQPSVEKKSTDETEVTLESDRELQNYIKTTRAPEKLATDILLSPLKKRIYEENCKINGGFYKNNTVVTLPETNLEYKLHLSRKEIEVLEPSIYLKSFRIKSSMKKTNIFLRLLGGLDVKKALTQCHFAKKKVARDVAGLLEKGMTDSNKLGLNPDDLYISQIWTGSDGSWTQRLDYKARGRVGIIRHRYVHVRCILKTKSITKKRLEYEASLKKQKRKAWIQLDDKPVRGVTGGVYKW